MGGQHYFVSSVAPVCSSAWASSGALHVCVYLLPILACVLHHAVSQPLCPCGRMGGSSTCVLYRLAGDKCGGCQGKCLISDKGTFEVHIEKGMKHGSKVVLRGEAGCSEPGLQPGDVVLVVQQRDHDVFKRIHADLIYQKKVSLVEALCGTTFTIKQLDGRVLKVTTTPGEVIKPDCFKCINEEGMPVHGRSYLKGNMYIQFDVEFPDSLEPEQVAALQSVFPSSSNGVMDSDDTEDVSLSSVSNIQEELKSRASLGRSRGDAYGESDEDDDMPRGSQRVQCAQQ
jgi:DnaJ homolog subfamily A member 2